MKTHLKEDSMTVNTRTYYVPVLRIVKFIDQDVITASTVEGQGNMWLDGGNPWEQAGGDKE